VPEDAGLGMTIWPYRRASSDPPEAGSARCSWRLLQCEADNREIGVHPVQLSGFLPLWKTFLIPSLPWAYRQQHAC